MNKNIDKKTFIDLKFCYYETVMLKHTQRKLLRYMDCGLLMVTGTVGNMVYGSQNAGALKGQQTLHPALPQVALAMATEKVSGDPHGDTRYLQAVRNGNVKLVELFLTNPHLNFNGTDNEGNTDLMLAIRGGEQDVFGANYRTIFNLLVQRGNRDWNLRNRKKQTALALAIGWGRMDAFKALLEEERVDPNLPNMDNTTPLILAIGNTLISAELRIAMASQLIEDPRVDVNRRGTDNKLPLQIFLEAKLRENAPEFFNAIIRRALIDYDREIKAIAREMIRRIILSFPTRGGRALQPDQVEKIIDEMLAPHPHNEILSHISEVLNDHPEINIIQTSIEKIRGLWHFAGAICDPKINVTDYKSCEINQLIDAIHRKINFLLNKEAPLKFPQAEQQRLGQLDKNTQLYDNFLTKKDGPTLQQLFAQLQ
ncbi:MAG: ankyrin repeat domain-containing protein [Puniceicoccales bacterium]|jgi:hypothetical protein|nr:ankyrin repeat domain-containing protein [Puniceicoccales bacterium]